MALAGNTILRKKGLGFAKPTDYARSVEECVYIGKHFLKAEGNFNGLVVSSGARAALSRRSNSKAFFKLGSHKCKRSLHRGIKANSIHGCLLSTPHMLAALGKSSG